MQTAGVTVNILAIDLGAESGRGILGRFDGERVRLHAIHRFPNESVALPDGLHWDVLRLYTDIKVTLATAYKETDGAIDSLGIDTWGVDFGLLDRTGALVANPLHYRDPRTDGMLDRAFDRVSRVEIYQATGIQAMPINTLCQLLALEDTPLLAIAETMLPMPDLFRYWLSGERTAEVTMATTTQLYRHGTADWAWDIINRLGIPARIFPPLVPPGETGAPLRADVATEAGLRSQPPMVTVASHDTASAVVAVPASNEHFAYISSGTWSLVGIELPAPVLSTAAMEANFTNEGGLGGTIRFLKNVMGLWLLQESRRTWARAGYDADYEELTALAATAPPFISLIDPDHPSFLFPGDIPARIAAYCRETGQVAPDGPGATVRCILESLALKYRWVIERIEALTDRSIQTVHVVGGGARNALLCRLTADATRRPVLAGPVEATALGNVLVQAMASRRLVSLADIRDVVRRSVEVTHYEPTSDAASWDAAYARLCRMMEAGGDSGMSEPARQGAVGQDDPIK
jgi:rhamnulokinase